jgi:hypothetical protein
MVMATATFFVVVGWGWCDETRWWVVVIVKETPHRLAFQARVGWHGAGRLVKW